MQVAKEESAREWRRREKVRVIEEVLKKMQEKLTASNDVKVTVSEFVRLMELEKAMESDLEHDQIQEIKVTWIDSPSQEPASGR